jgi:hypothetical protein
VVAEAGPDGAVVDAVMVGPTVGVAVDVTKTVGPGG